eukprot:CAMPEP_0180524898 /NCGR_PEP_ID=MMETSP1036_2-20121128/58873_1 /TAXON_ID=632150 /ORGANISM="Azadinium spinosum, Strain 3D9" /LENGTH=71 /DNA_ID=CAMNT_0022538147 /DNA_START=29 /DNA_END=241 /DNA_ORIENTATION=+
MSRTFPVATGSHGPSWSGLWSRQPEPSSTMHKGCYLQQAHDGLRPSRSSERLDTSRISPLARGSKRMREGH